MSIKQEVFKETKAVVRELMESITDGRHPTAISNVDLARLAKAKKLLDDYSDPGDFTPEENKLPSAAQIGDRVFLFYRNQRLDGTVIGVHFIMEAVKYDVELSFGSVKWDNQAKTRIYNVQSGFVSADPNNLPLNEDLDSAMDDMAKFIANSESLPEAFEKELRARWVAVENEILA